jgi:hypothetical protein
MPDAPATDPVDAQLMAARAGGSTAYLAAADALVAAGGILPARHARWTAEIRQAVGRVGANAGGPMHHGGSVAQYRDYVMADNLVRSGADPVRVTEIMREEGHEAWTPDTRTARERQIDAEHGIVPYTDTAVYRVSLPAQGLGDAGFTPEATAEFRNAACALAAELQFDPQSGSTFVSAIATEIAKQNAMDAPARAAHVANTQAILERVYGDKLPGYVAAINAMLDTVDVANKAFVNGLRPGQPLCDPFMFARLLGRGQTIQAWKEARGL